MTSIPDHYRFPVPTGRQFGAICISSLDISEIEMGRDNLDVTRRNRKRCLLPYEDAKRLLAREQRWAARARERNAHLRRLLDLALPACSG